MVFETVLWVEGTVDCTQRLTCRLAAASGPCVCVCSPSWLLSSSGQAEGRKAAEAGKEAARRRRKSGSSSRNKQRQKVKLKEIIITVLIMADDALDGCLDFCSGNTTTVNGSCVTECLDGEGYSIQKDGGGIPFAVSISIAPVLICFSALFSGLTLGLMSLDIVALKVLETAGDEKEKEYAKKIIPVRNHGNLLLCTLLLGNTIVNNGVSILLADLTSGVIGLVTSVVLVLMFGEIMPQAVCSRHALYIGSKTIWIVKIFRALFFPFCYPLSLILNWVLGRDIGNVYSLEEIKRLLELHATDPDAKAESGLNERDHQLLLGALEYKDKRVQDVMTSLDQCYMLEASERLSFTVMLDIYKSGFTRIPVYSRKRDNIIGVLYAKDLILVDPEDEIELTTILSFRGRHGGHIFEDTKLDKTLAKFLASGLHLMIVHRRSVNRKSVDSPTNLEHGEHDIEKGEDRMVKFDLGPLQDRGSAPGEEDEGQVVGIITLEDVMEELIRTEIVDESDQWEDVEARVPRRIAQKTDIDGFLQMFERKAVTSKGLSKEEIAAISAFLALNVEEFAILGRNDLALKTLVAAGTLVERNEPHARSQEPGTPSSSAAQSPTAELASKSSNIWPSDASFTNSHVEDEDLLLYMRGEQCSHFTLILQGKIEVRTGKEDFAFELGPWSVLGQRALSQESYVPDFDAIAVPPCRLLKIDRGPYRAAIAGSKYSVMLGARMLRKEIQGASRLSTTSMEEELSAGEGSDIVPSGSTRGLSRFGREEGSQER